MKISYEVTADDIVAFNHYHFDHSPSLRRGRAIAVWLLPIVWVMFGAWLVYVKEIDYESFVLIWVFPSVSLVILLKRFFTWSIQRQVRQLLNEGRTEGILGPRELELTAEGVVERTPVNESKWAYRAVARVASTDRHTFIYLTAVTAHVVPREAVADGEYEPFVYALRERAEAAKQPKILSVEQRADQ